MTVRVREGSCDVRMAFDHAHTSLDLRARRLLAKRHSSSQPLGDACRASQSTSSTSTSVGGVPMAFRDVEEGDTGALSEPSSPRQASIENGTGST